MHGTTETTFVEWRPLAELASIVPQWRALAARALAPNVFYEPGFALAAQPAFGADVGAGLVWSQGMRLVGLFPARIARWHHGVLVGWTHPYAPFGAPLIDRDAGAAVIGAWLDHLAGHTQLPSLMLLPMLPQTGALAAAFDAALTQRGGRSVAFAVHQRALLAPPDDRTDYVEQALGRKKFKELRRQLRRLGDGVTSDIARDPATVAAALGDFLALEAAGWKGRRGTAAQNDPAILAFISTAVVQLAWEGKAEIARLYVDTKPIAAIIMLRSGDTAWCWKIAYDEAYARTSPGVQLLLRVTTALLADAKVARADSCAAPNHPMIDHVWRERLPLADRLVRVGPRNGAGFAVACAFENARRAAAAAAKGARDLLRP